jgi:hypothetical protein
MWAPRAAAGVVPVRPPLRPGKPLLVVVNVEAIAAGKHRLLVAATFLLGPPPGKWHG